MHEICPRYAHDMHEICLRYAKDMPKICPRYALDIPKIYQRHIQDTPKACPRYDQNMPKICPWYPPRYTQDAPKKWPRYAQVTPKIYPRYSQDMPKILSNLNKITQWFSNMDQRGASASKNLPLNPFTSLQQVSLFIKVAIKGVSPHHKRWYLKPLIPVSSICFATLCRRSHVNVSC